MSIPHLPAGLMKFEDAVYFDIDLPSSSTTKALINGTNAHLAHEREQTREENDAFTLGAYLHALLLAPPATIENDFIKLGKIDRRTIAGKDLWAAAQRRAELSGARIITADLVEQGESMAASVRDHVNASTLLASLAHREITIIGEIAGRPAKAKIDGIATKRHSCLIVDIKTTESAAPKDFAGSAAKFGYFHQAAFYRRLAEQQVSVVDDFLIIAVEKKAPYLTVIYRIPSVAMDVADQKIDALVERWWQVNEGDRTGYPSSIQDLEPPRWWLANE